MKLKVCGLRDNIDEVAALEPDFMGFICYDKSPRFIGESFSKNINTKAIKVGVFVNQPVDEVLDLVRKHQFDFVQLHGSENVDYCVELKAYDIKLIKVFAGNKLPDQFEIDAFLPFVDYFLFDTKLETHGGTGMTFDWNNLKTLTIKKPIFLSGGLSLDNIESIKELQGLEIFAIDVNSKFEISPGRKDIEKLKSLKKLMTHEI
ncbi:phosphoribosylanthranilate isomerase [Fulvivirga lutimaris]|nr:phosphoribosylanthranilate isomerase [Fulvivirga lutimaris]